MAEVLYAKLYDKYTKLKVNKFSEMDVHNKDQEVKFMNYMTVVEEMMEFLKKENGEIKFQNNELRNLLMDEKEKNRSLSEELEKLRNLQREGFSGATTDNTSADALVQPVDVPDGSSKKMRRKRQRQSLLEAEDTSTQAMSGHESETVKDFSKETIPSGALISTQKPECSRRTIDSSDADEDDSTRTNRIYQFLVECLIGMKVFTVNQNGELSISVQHESSGYSIDLSMVNIGAAKEVELMIRLKSLGILERVVPECMKEDIIVSKNMCPIFFERVFRIINIHT